MKNNIILTCLILAITFIGCQKDDEYDAPNSFSDVGWYIGYPVNPLPDTLLINKDDYISFSDLSQSATTHKWEIESGNFFLDHPIKRNDSVFDDKIIGSGSIADKTVSVWFRKSGFNKVKFINTFKEKVTFRGPGFTIEADSVGPGEWLIDNTFVVDVYDSIVPIIRIEQDGVVLDHENPNDTIFVEAGGSLDFFDLTTQGRPDDWEWSIGGSRNFEQNPTIVLKKLGTFQGQLELRRAGLNIPGDYEQYKIPAPFKVIPSSQPFVVIPEDIIELEDQTIQVPFNGEFAPFLNQKQYFTVTLNGVETTNFDLAINSNDATILDIKFNETIYRNDTITVSYDGNGTLESTDTRSPVAFGPETVKMFQHEVVVFDFEDGGVNWTAHPENLATTTITPSTEQAASGAFSLKVDAAASGNWSSFRNLVDQYSLTAGVKYQMEYKIYKVAGAAINMNGPWIAKDGGGTVVQFWNNTVKDAPADTWVTVSPGGRYTAAETADFYEIYIRHNGQGVLYFDDIKILITDER
ncbi:hypothetical protein [Algibacter sp. 2305UL17-15]|uniref:hypothetical protein n=1 Tax=Algibacter sp. 2305UL17-15 TaxID=3231268 RepID=UPI00345A4CD3